MKKLLVLILCLLLPATALADGLPMYENRSGTTHPKNARIRQYLSDFTCFWGEETVNLRVDQRVPVYSYPSEEGWRANDGKAAVSFKEPFTALAWTENGEWLLIDYEIGEKNALGTCQHRIGYIRWIDLPAGVQVPVSSECLVRVPMRLARDGWLYDDLNGLMKLLFMVAAGETVTVLGYVDDAWAYVETEIDGKPARSFLPMAVLEAPAETEDAAMMAALEGTWVFAGGGEVLGYGAVFDGTGTVLICDTEDFESFPPKSLIAPVGCRREYSVYPNTLGTMRYPSAQWVLEIRDANGNPSRMGLVLYTDENGQRCLGIELGEGGGGYVYAPDTMVIAEKR